MRKLSSFFCLAFVLSFSLISHAIITSDSSDKALDNDATETIYLDLDSAPGMQSCTGVIVQAHLILTAGHCLQMLGLHASSIRISNRISDVGEPFHKGPNSNMTEISIAKMAISPGYTKVKSNNQKDASNVQFDLGYIMTNDDLSKIFSHLRLPQIPTDLDEVSKTAGVLMTAGYGRTFPGSVSAGNFNSYKRLLMMKSLGITTDNYWVATSDEAKRGTCEGDSGAGLFIQNGSNRLLIGILSGSSTQDGKPLPVNQCGSIGERSVYLDITKQLCWILSETGIRLNQNLRCQ